MYALIVVIGRRLTIIDDIALSICWRVTSRDTGLPGAATGIGLLGVMGVL